ncbi:MAG: Mov34/MPN/PAD-1 family protein [Anaerolineales bacterium]
MIRLLPDEASQAKSGHIPTKHARRWHTDVEFAKNRVPQVSVFLSQKTFVRICVHAGSDLNNEVGGWLLGKWRADHETGEEFIVVDAILPAIYTRQGSAFLTFTQDSQVAMHSLMEEKYPDKDLVGWYHTHPRMGLFLSSHDLFLHNNFFPKPWQVALVVEPHTNVGGFFIRDQKGEMDARHHFGFYEIITGRSRSVVHWANLEPAQEDLPVEEGER